MISIDEQREKFEHWVTGGDTKCRSVERNRDGEYILMQTHMYWNAWQAAFEAMNK